MLKVILSRNSEHYVFQSTDTIDVSFTHLQLSTTSLGVPFASICLSGKRAFNSSHFAGVLFHTIRGTSSYPATPCDRRRPAIPSPMIPRPINPIGDMAWSRCGCFALLLASVRYGSVAKREQYGTIIKLLQY